MPVWASTVPVLAASAQYCDGTGQVWHAYGAVFYEFEKY